MACPQRRTLAKLFKPLRSRELSIKLSIQTKLRLPSNPKAKVSHLGAQGSYSIALRVRQTLSIRDTEFQAVRVCTINLKTKCPFLKLQIISK